MTDLFAVIESAEVTEAQWNSLAATGTPHASSTRARAFASCNLTVLALDLGTITGWAVAPRGGALRSGSFELQPSKLGGNGRRWIAFREWLTATRARLAVCTRSTTRT